jgi:FG-GAP-like repeat/ASPIC and UnbV
MQCNLKNSGLMAVTLVGALLSLAVPRSLAAVGPTEGLITLDALCEPPEARNPVLAPGNPAPSTRRMAELLAGFHQKPAPNAMTYMNDRLVALLQAKLAAATDVREKFKLQFEIGIQQMQAGWPDRALNTFVALEHFVAGRGGKLDRGTAEELRMCKALAFLRLGEQENCLARHNAESCLLPLTPLAYHVLPRGSRGAIALLNEQLAQSPDDLSARWLLNLAHMTLGEYPDKVPARFLIPPRTFASEYEMPRFKDVSAGLGLDASDLAGGVIIDDFDNDGLYDVFISAWDLEGQLRYFHNNGNGTFTERTSEAGLVGEVGALNIQQTDYNNDGLLDLWLLRGGWKRKGGRLPSSLLRNNGNGTFTDMTEEAGLMSFHPSQTSRWFDYDGDGWLDLFIGHESLDPNDPDWCELFHNNRDGTFTECASACGIKIAAFVKGVASADYDNDGRPDLYLSVGDGKNILLHNDGPDASRQWHFSDVTTRSGPITDPILSFGTFFFDYDNDGWDDLLVFGYNLRGGLVDVAADYLGLPNSGSKTKLYRNNHDGTFSDVIAATHLDRICYTMGHNYGDLDNDGWLDFYCGTGDPDLRTLIPKRMFRNAEGKFFQDVSSATGTGHLQKGHGVAFADLNNDGAQDVYISLGGAFTGDGARNALFLNPGNTNHWLKLKLTGGKANRPAIGARIKITVQTHTGPRDLYRTVSSGGSFGSNPLRQEIGLGTATAITAVDIRWPGSNTRQALTGLELDHSYEISEDNNSAIPMKLHPVQLDHSTPTPSPAKVQKMR